MKKAFKYFDLNDNGTVEPDEFSKAIEKIGIQIPTKKVSSGFFDQIRNFCKKMMQRFATICFGYSN